MKNLFLSTFFLFFAVLVTAITANAQNDTVCAGSTGIKYKITGGAGSSFSWVADSGQITTLVSTGDSISVNWAGSAGIDTLKVVEINATGCPGDTMKLAVVRLKPTVVLSGTDSICANSATTLSKLKMTFTGVGPWTVNYDEAGTSHTNITVTTSPYTFNSQVFTTSGVKTYTITSVTDSKNCPADISASGNANVSVFAKPVTSPIIRY